MEQRKDILMDEALFAKWVGGIYDGQLNGQVTGILARLLQQQTSTDAPEASPLQPAGAPDAPQASPLQPAISHFLFLEKKSRGTLTRVSIRSLKKE